MRCSSTAMVFGGIEVTAGDRHDRVTGAGDFDGGAGDDILTSGSGGALIGGDGADVLNGSAAADRLTPGAGSDRVSAGAGDDVVIDEAGTPAGDVLDGGAGFDYLAFTGRGADVAVDIGPSRQAAGSAGEGNTVTGFEIGGGGSGDDTVRLSLDHGSSRPRVTPLSDLGAGDDVLVGSPGRNVLGSGRGADRIDAGAGSDELSNEDDGQLDVLRGGAGNDSITNASNLANRPSTVGDSFRGGSGNDSITARDRGPDRVSCGGGRRDRLLADRRDRATGCEQDRRRGR